MGRMVIAVYRPRAGQADQLLEVLKDHLPLLRREGLASDRPCLVMRAADGTLLEAFEWKSAEAIAQAHANPSVRALWARFEAVCEYRRLADIKESQDLFAEFEPVELETSQSVQPISHLQMMTIYVRDLDRALDFYTNTLGFVKTAEYDDGKGERLVWVVPEPALEVALATEIALYAPQNPDDPRIGAASGIVFTSRNIAATYDMLKARGVHFTKELIRHNYGKGEGDQEANFVDPDGNLFLLHT
jgi:catechol 2,3-dioxygenase-like lactoylglutathione lyase family enzyme